MGVLKPSGNSLYLLKHSTPSGRLPSVARLVVLDSDVPMTVQCDPVLWRKRFGHFNIQRLHAQHAKGGPTSLAMFTCVKLSLVTRACRTRPVHHLVLY
jgi:hypothetical protein